MLAASLDPLHRSAGEPRRQRDQRDVRIERALDPEAAADVGRHDEAQLVLRHPERARGERVHDERAHEVRPHGVDAVDGIPAGDDAVRLDGCRAELREAEALADHDLRLRERTVGIAVHEPAVSGEIRADRLVQRRRARLERTLDVDHGR